MRMTNQINLLSDTAVKKLVIKRKDYRKDKRVFFRKNKNHFKFTERAKLLLTTSEF